MTETEQSQEKSPYEEFREWFDSICHIDEWGFERFKHEHWLPESPEEELHRLEFNLACYREYLKYRTQFPPEVKKARTAEFHRVRELRNQLGVA